VVLQQVVVSELLVEEAEQVPVLALARVAAMLRSLLPVLQIKQQAVPVIKQQEERQAKIPI
jgi:hypothetical protein